MNFEDLKGRTIEDVDVCSRGAVRLITTDGSVFTIEAHRGFTYPELSIRERKPMRNERGEK